MANVKIQNEDCVRNKSESNGNVRFPYLSIIQEKEEEKEKSGLKQRKSNIEDLTSALTLNEKKEEKKVSSKQDPIKWFGVLVPNSLRQSQKCFKKAVECSVDCANLQNEMNGIIARRKHLHKLEKKAGTTKI